jgi:hypothetical protein
MNNNITGPKTPVINATIIDALIPFTYTFYITYKYPINKKSEVLPSLYYNFLNSGLIKFHIISE